MARILRWLGFLGAAARYRAWLGMTARAFLVQLWMPKRREAKPVQLPSTYQGSPRAAISFAPALPPASPDLPAKVPQVVVVAQQRTPALERRVESPKAAKWFAG